VRVRYVCDRHFERTQSAAAQVDEAYWPGAKGGYASRHVRLSQGLSDYGELSGNGLTAPAATASGGLTHWKCIMNLYLTGKRALISGASKGLALLPLCCWPKRAVTLSSSREERRTSSVRWWRSARDRMFVQIVPADLSRQARD
jgi:hypothetical protein